MALAAQTSNIRSSTTSQVRVVDGLKLKVGWNPGLRLCDIGADELAVDVVKSAGDLRGQDAGIGGEEGHSIGISRSQVVVNGLKFLESSQVSAGSERSREQLC